MYTKKITYSREFLSGSLAGMTIRGCAVYATAATAHAIMVRLGAYDRRNPGTETLTGNLYWNYNIACEDIAPAPTPAPAAAVEVTR
jgi:hypothetical protein